MHDATYQLRADELDDVLVQTIKNTYQEREIIILSKDDYDEGKGIAKTLAELEALANE
jgi:trehalose-6-phosphate synthase